MAKKEMCIILAVKQNNKYWSYKKILILISKTKKITKIF